jgi:hypothetical protein
MSLQKWHECFEGLLHPCQLIAVVDTAIVLCSVQMSVPGSRNSGYKKKTFCVSKVQSLGGLIDCRPLRLPGVLVGDGKLGGISSTVGAYESLQIRGYDTIAIVLVDSGLSNEQALSQYLKHR